MNIGELLNLLEKIAPRGLAYEWDNTGLQLGSHEWQADKVLLALEATPQAAEYALEHGFQVVICHHPLIFKPISQITNPLLLSLMENRIAVICLHTNLDLAPQGVNYALAEVLDIKVNGLLSQESGSKWYHGSLTVPAEYAERVTAAAHGAGAGRIGHYDHCGTRHKIEGTFRALERSNPFLGERGIVETVPELELEFMVDSFHLAAVKKAIVSAHPYETPAMYFIEVENSNPAYGLGLCGELEREIALGDFAHLVKEKLQTPAVQLWTAGKEEKTPIRRIALCGGSAATLIRQTKAVTDVFVTGELGYHSMLESSVPIVCAGHFHTEYPGLSKLAGYLADNIQVAVLPAKLHEINRKLRIY